MDVMGEDLFIILVGIGIWKVERIKWKIEIIERVDERVNEDKVEEKGKEEWENINRKDDK